jgi:anaerobic magnesium-protoporphyrin IX monomethyl ester cyclase
VGRCDIAAERCADDDARRPHAWPAFEARMIDCLFVGHNDGDFAEHVQHVRSMGVDSGAWRRLSLAFVEIDGVPRRSMDVINLYNDPDGRRPRLSNLDSFSPAIAYLASYIMRRGFSADYVNLFHDERSTLAQKLAADDVLAVAVTTTLYVGTKWLNEVIAFVRRHNRTAKIIVGGPFIRNQAALRTPEELSELFEEIGADIYVISQEGELALSRVLDALKRRRSLAFIDNIAYQRRGRYLRTGTSIESNDLVADMVQYDRFPPSRFGEFVAVRTAKSCPFACSFCAFPQQAGKYRYEGIAAVEQELDNVRSIGTVTTLTFLDDTFNVPMGRFKDILRMMIRNRYPFRWNSFLRADHVDAECIELMRQSGCEGVFLGVESGSDRMLQAMNKTSRAANYRRVIPLLRDAGILTHCSFIIGFPGETAATVRETVELIEDTAPDTYRAQMWFCDRTTPVWKQREAFGLTGAGFEWRHPTMDASEAMDIVERLFFSVRNSQWLPQHGFESWSLFYLQRKGMPLDQVMTFIRRFNEAVGFTLRHPAGTPLEPKLLHALARSSRFERVDARDAIFAAS